MKIEAVGLMYAPRISLYLVPETEVERVLLANLWKHGVMETTNGVCDGSGCGFAITQKPVRADGGLE